MSGRYPHISFIPFEGFLDFLQENGFPIGVDSHVRVQNLLNRLDPHTPSKTLKNLLCPLFARSPKEQEKFYRLYDSYFELLDHLNPEGIPQKKKVVTQPQKPRRSWRISKWIFQLTAFVLMLMFGWIIWQGYHSLKAAPEYLNRFNLENNLENKTKFAVRDMLGLWQICDSLKADFTHQLKPLDGGLWEASFINLSKGKIQSYAWDFGGKGESAEISPVDTFTNPGNYQVSLWITSYQDCKLSIFKNIEILPIIDRQVVKSQINVSFEYDILPSGNIVLFRDSSIVKGSPVKTRLWKFGDKVTSDEASPKHTYQEYGEYDVSLTLELEDGNTATQRRRLPLVDPQDSKELLPLTVKSLTQNNIDDLAIGFMGRFSALIRIAAMMILIIGLLFYILYKRNRRSASLREEKRASPPYSLVFQLPEPLSIVNPGQFQQAARQLRKRQVSEITVVDIPATITATLEAGGYPAIVRKASTRPSEYLVLIDRLSFKDHQARHFESLINLLAGEDIYIDLYFFKSDFSVLWKKLDERPVYIQDLKIAYPNHRLVIMSDGATLLDAVSGERAEPSFDFLQWSDRALLTPESTADWGFREVTISRSFLVIPATSNGLISLVEQFDKDEPKPLREWMKNGDRTVPDLEGDPETVLEEVKEYLGPECYEWVCGCALYPELQWDLTLHIGQALSPDTRSLVNENHILRLLRLSWFRKGFIPDKIRWHMAKSLDSATEKKVRRAIIALLEKHPFPKDSFAANQQQMNIVLQKWGLDESKGKEKRQVRQELEAMLEREEVDDYLVLKNLEQKNHRVLDSMMPQSWKKVVYKQGMPLLGVNNILLLLVAIPVLLGLYFYEPADPSRIVKEEGNYFYLETASDSARFFDHKGVRNYLEKDYVLAANNFLDALGASSASPDPVLYYHRGLALYQMSKSYDQDSIKILNMSEAYDNFSQAIGLQPLFNNKTKASLEQGKPGERQPLWSGPALLSPTNGSVLGIEDGIATLYRPGKPPLPLNNSGTVITTQFSPDGKLIVLGFQERYVTLFDAATGEPGKRFDTRLHTSLRLARLSPGNEHLVVASSDGSLISLWDVATQSLRKELTLHKGAIKDARFSPDGRWLISGGNDTTAIIWNVAEGKPITFLNGHPREVNLVAFSPLGNMVLTVANNSVLKLWTIEGKAIRPPLTYPNSSLVGVLFSPDGSMIWTFDEKNIVQAFNILLQPILTLNPLATQEGTNNPVNNDPAAVLQLPSFAYAFSSDMYGLSLLTSSNQKDHLWKFDPTTFNDTSLQQAAMYNRMVVDYELENFDHAISTLNFMIGKDSLNPNLYYARALCRLSHEKGGEEAFWLPGLMDLKRVTVLSPNYLDTLGTRSLLSRVYAIAENKFLLGQWICEVDDPLCDLLAYEEIGPASEGLRAVKKSTGGWGYVDEKTQELKIDLKFERAGTFSNGKARVMAGDVQQIIDKNGNVVFDEVGKLSNGRIAVKTPEGKWGFVDSKLKTVVSPVFEKVQDFDSYGFAIVKADEKFNTWGVIGKNGEKEAEFSAEKVESFDPKTGTFTIIKNKSIQTTKPLSTISTRPPLAEKPSEEARDEATGKLFDSTEGDLMEGMQLAKKNGLFGYISLVKGSYVVKIPFQYEDGWDFSQGYAPVKKRGKWGFIDKNGVQVTPFIYDRVISRPKDDYVIGCVQEGKNSYCIDRLGNCINFDKFYCAPSEEQVQQKVMTPRSYSLPNKVIKTGKSDDRP